MKVWYVTLEHRQFEIKGLYFAFPAPSTPLIPQAPPAAFAVRISEARVQATVISGGVRDMRVSFTRSMAKEEERRRGVAAVGVSTGHQSPP